VQAVQPGRGARWRAVRTVVLTCLAGLLVLLALDLPNDPDDLGPGAFLRLPLEALVYLAVVLALPRRLGRLRVVLAVAVGVLLGLSALLRILDIGFLQALDRPFDVLVDWRYAGSLLSLVQDSMGERAGVALLVGAALTAVVMLVLLPLAVLRLTRVAVRNRVGAGRALAAAAPLWVALAVLDVHAAGGPVAAHATGPYVYGQFSRIGPELRDQREFAEAVKEEEPPRAAPARELLAGLKGKDVFFVFVESYGRVALENPVIAPGVQAVLTQASRDLGAAGFSSRTAWLTSPTFGGLSWLAHSTMQSGLWIDSQTRYDLLVRSHRMTLSRFFGNAGWRSVAVIPANNRDWLQGRFYHYDRIYDSRNLGYEGPMFGYPTMPDQFTLEAFHRLELARKHRRPVMAEVDLLNSHSPWSKTPRMIPWSDLGDGSVFNGMPDELPTQWDIGTSPPRVQAAYGGSIEYSLTALTGFIKRYADKDTVVVFMGDHQPASIVSGKDASHDVPITVIAKDPQVLARISRWNWDDGLRPRDGSPVWRMDQFRDRFLDAYESTAPRPRRVDAP
jgi:hypothetical protein